MTNQIYEMLLRGEAIKAVNTLMETKMGGMWYLMILLAPIVMIYIKTESMSFTAMILFWSVGLFGSLLFPDGITNALFTVCILLGFAVLAFKVFSPVK